MLRFLYFSIALNAILIFVVHTNKSYKRKHTKLQTSASGFTRELKIKLPNIYLVLTG